MPKKITVKFELSDKAAKVLGAFTEELRAARVNDQAMSISGRLVEPAQEKQFKRLPAGHFEKRVRP